MMSGLAGCFFFQLGVAIDYLQSAKYLNWSGLSGAIEAREGGDQPAINYQPVIFLLQCLSSGTSITDR